MGKKVSSVFMAVVFAVFPAFLIVKGAEAFCVYNETDALIKVQQTSGHKTFQGFTESIDQGDKKCCNWENTDCNKEGKRDSIVKFTVNYLISDLYRRGVAECICKDFPIKAGGWLTIEGKDGKYKCVRHDY